METGKKLSGQFLLRVFLYIWYIRFQILSEWWEKQLLSYRWLFWLWWTTLKNILILACHHTQYYYICIYIYIYIYIYIIQYYSNTQYYSCNFIGFSKLSPIEFPKVPMNNVQSARTLNWCKLKFNHNKIIR
jgi:hypothetical protein